MLFLPYLPAIPSLIHLTVCLCHVPCAALFVAATATTVEFWKVDPTAGKLMLPYLAFIGYANALNYYFWKNNPDVSMVSNEVVSSPVRWRKCAPGRGDPKLRNLLMAC